MTRRNPPAAAPDTSGPILRDAEVMGAPNPGTLTATAQMLRQAIDPDRLRRVLRMAGADEVVGDAPQALREAAADAVARRLADGRLPWTTPTAATFVAGAGNLNTLEEARAATKRPYVELALHLCDAQLKAETAQQALAMEIARLSHHAVAYARAEGRALDHLCVAVAAGRNSDAVSTPFVVPGV